MPPVSGVASAPQAVTPAGDVETTAELNRDGSKLSTRPRDRVAAGMRTSLCAALPTGPSSYSCGRRGEWRGSRRSSIAGRKHIVCPREQPGRRPRREIGPEASIERSSADSEGVSADIPVSAGSRDVDVRGPYRVVDRWALRHFVEQSYIPNKWTIMLLPFSAAPRAETEAQIVTSSAEYGLWNASMSPDSRWICFNAVRGPAPRGSPWSARRAGTRRPMNGPG